MPVSKPDATKFDNANDSIAESRPELYTLVTSFNTIADEYNAGTLGGSDKTQLTAGTGISITQPDSADAWQIASTITGGITLPNTSITSTNFTTPGTLSVTALANATNAFHNTGSGASTLEIELQDLEVNGVHYVWIERSQVSGGLSVDWLFNAQNFSSITNGSDDRLYQIRIIDTGKQGSSAGNNLIYISAVNIISFAVND